MAKLNFSKLYRITIIIVIFFITFSLSCQSTGNKESTGIINKKLSNVNGTIDFSEQVKDSLPSVPKPLKDNTIFGEWKVYKFVGGAYAEISDLEAKDYLNKKIILENNYSVIFADTCDAPSYSARSSNANEYMYFNYRFYPEHLGIYEKNIVVLEIFCGMEDSSGKKDFADYDFIKFQEDYLIYFDRGYFFYLVKA